MDVTLSRKDLLLNFLSSMCVWPLLSLISIFRIYDDDPIPNTKIIVPIVVSIICGILSFILDKKKFKEKTIILHLGMLSVFLFWIVPSGFLAFYITGFFYTITGIKASTKGAELLFILSLMVSVCIPILIILAIIRLINFFKNKSAVNNNSSEKTNKNDD